MYAGQYDQALQELGILESVLQRDDVAQLPAMQRRRGFENFVIATLKGAIAEALGAGTREEGIGIETLNRISETVDEADRLLQAGDQAGARTKYLVALKEIPEFDRVHSTLTNMDRQLVDQDKLQKAVTIQNLQEEISSLRYELSDQKQKMTAAMETQSQWEELDKERRSMVAQLDLIKDLYEVSFSNESTSQEDLLAMLQTKLLIKQIVSSEPVRSRYPQLYDSLEEYFASFGQEQERVGHLAAFQDIAALLNDLIEEQEVDLSSIRSGNVGDRQHRLFLEIIDKLKKLFE
ncbi:hypothetical protein LCGC14_1683580 [marine sediment metagenome]|uniref:Uncharacterized protein n=1 Tax=marine sediment metagenome TaxID=412755 RepID=A0A0F9KMX4_9ZZZZ